MVTASLGIVAGKDGIMSVIISKFECLPIKSSLWTRKYRSGYVT